MANTENKNLKTALGPTVFDKALKAEALSERDKIICADFMELREKYPKDGITTIFNTLAYLYWRDNKEHKGIAYPMTSVGIRNVILKYGLYSSKNKEKDNDDRGETRF